MEGQAPVIPKTAEEDKSAALWYTLAGGVAFYVYGGILVVGIILPALVLAGRRERMSAITVAIIGFASVIGDFFIKYSTVKAGVYKRVRVGPNAGIGAS